MRVTKEERLLVLRYMTGKVTDGFERVLKAYEYFDENSPNSPPPIYAPAWSLYGGIRFEEDWRIIRYYFEGEALQVAIKCSLGENQRKAVAVRAAPISDIRADDVNWPLRDDIRLFLDLKLLTEWAERRADEIVHEADEDREKMERFREYRSFVPVARLSLASQEA